MQKTVQDFMIKDLLEVEENAKSNETLQLLEFTRDSVALTENQIKAFFLCREFGLDDIADFAYNAKRSVTPFKRFLDLISKLTLADRIRGNAKLSHLMKASANPASDALKPKDVQAQGMSRKEIGG